MSVNIIYDPSIKFVNTITWSKVSDLQEIPELLLNDGLSNVFISNEKKRRFKDDTVINLSARLHDLQVDLDRYNPSLIQQIINFFTGKFFTLCRLRNCLSDLISIVNNIAKKILEKQGKELKDQKRMAEIRAQEEQKKIANEERRLALKIAEEERKLTLKKAEEERKLALKKAEEEEKIALKKAEEERKQARLKLVLTAKQASINALSLAPKTNRSPTIDFNIAAGQFFEAFEKLEAPDEEAIEKGEEIRVNESNLPISNEDLNYKLTLVGRAKKIVDHYASTFKPSNPQTETPDYSLQTVQKVQKYIRMLLIKLAQNKNVPLPRWYHATGKYEKVDHFNSVEKIVRGGFLHQTGAPYGYGTYFSTRDEFESGYGHHTFVLDEGALSDDALNPTLKLKKSKVTYFVHNPGRLEKAIAKRDRYQAALWLRVSNLEKFEYSLPPLDCVPVNPNTVAFMATSAPEAARKKLNYLKCNISALPREDVDFIRLVFDAAESQKHSNFSKYDLEQDEKALVKFRHNGKLIASGGRLTPSTWQPYDSASLTKNTYHLEYNKGASSIQLEVTRKKTSLAEAIECLSENYPQ